GVQAEVNIRCLVQIKRSEGDRLVTESNEWGHPVLVGEYRNFGEALLAAGQQFGEREAFVSANERLSYAQWARSAQGLAALLQERGIGPGDTVAIIVPTSIDYAICAAAVELLGAVASGINTRLGPREIQAILAKA